MSMISTINVKGMTCSHCARKIQAALGKQVGIEEVDVDLKGNKVTVTFHDSETSLMRINEVIEDTGYKVIS